MTQTEIDHIKDALEKLDEEMALSYQRRSHLRSKLNGHLSATRNLPPEVLTEIFRLSACKLNLREPQFYSIGLRVVLKLGSICSHWRRVAWSAPILWTTCLLAQDDIVPPSSIIALVLSNAQGSYVSVEVDLNDLPRESMLLLFQRYRTQIRDLRVRLSNDDYSHDGWDRAAQYFIQPTEWPNLTELSVCLSENSSPSGLMLQIPGADSLHHHRQERDNLTWYAPMHQLSILRLHHFPVDQCLYLLLHCPSLIEFHCLNPFTHHLPLFDSETLFGQSRLPKTLPNLKTFQWKVINEDWNILLFSSLRFPNLERLYWGSLHTYYSQPLDGLINEFMPSLSNIIALDWDVPFHSLSSFKTVFAETNLNSLQRLYIIASNPYNLITWLEALTVNQQHGQCRLPGLRHIYIEIRNVDPSEPRTFHILHKFLRSRRDKLLLEDGVIDNPRESGYRYTLLERFILEITEGPLRLEQHQMNALGELVNDGLIFDIVLPTEEPERTTTLG